VPYREPRPGSAGVPHAAFLRWPPPRSELAGAPDDTARPRRALRQFSQPSHAGDSRSGSTVLRQGREHLAAAGAAKAIEGRPPRAASEPPRSGRPTSASFTLWTSCALGLDKERQSSRSTSESPTF
jgi:hypothetical protein